MSPSLDETRTATYCPPVRVREVLGPGSPLSRLLAGYEHRPAQLDMAEAVEAAISDDRPLFVEAGTGTGKTLAYLIPAILSGKKVIISTATRALQEQIFTKDIPLVRDVLKAHGVPVNAALMKGLSNYLCKRRFQELRTSGETHGQVRRWLPLVEQWAKETETGDRAELAGLPEDAEIWREVQSSSDTRIGAECTYFDECHVTEMRREAERAQIVVVNHHLFLADLALRTGRSGDYASAIPNYDVVIFDEAHQIEDIATDFFGVRVSTARIDSLLRDSIRTLTSVGLLDVVVGSGQARPILELSAEASQNFFFALSAVVAAGARSGPGPGQDTRRVLTREDWTPEVTAALGKLDTCLEALQRYAESKEDEEAVALIARRTRDLRSDLQDIVQGSKPAARPERAPFDDDPEPPPSDKPEKRGEARITWIDARDRSVAIGASPIDLGPTLRSRLFDRVPCVICTSATLATAHGAGPPSFHFARARLGAPRNTVELVVPSPFDYPSRAALYVARDLPEPSDPAFEQAATARILELLDVTQGGAFVLCTSSRAMRAFHGALRSRTRLPLMIQGEAPKHLLLSRFRAAGNAVLVATMSFWVGVDVPGHALRLVILDKIPFAVPTDPVIQARSAEVERNGGNPFAQLSVPAAAITLKQGFGRLLRTQKDAGIVALLDRRVVTKSYGRMLLGSLPPARRASSMEAVREFWAGVSGTLDG